MAKVKKLTLEDFTKEDSGILAELERRWNGQSLFRPEYVEQARKLYAWGHTDLEVADFFQVNEETLRCWAAASPLFAEMRKSGKGNYDERIEEALRQRAQGYDKPVEKVFYNSKKNKVIRVATKEHIPACPKSMQFWLNNRQPEKWRIRRELTGANGAPLHPEGGAPKRSIVETARRITFLMQRATDELNGGPQPLMIEERITETTER
jgi:hypothetical protein